MASLNDMLITARSGVLTHQERLAVTSHNISNADTPGYHRQQVAVEANPPNEPNLYDARNYATGTGVRVADVVRVYNRMRETALLEQTSSYQGSDTLAGSLNDLEGLLSGSTSGSLDTLLQNFGDAWSDVANSPGTLAERGVLLERADALADQLNLLSARLTRYRAGIADGGAGPAFTGLVPSIVSEINDLATRVQALNARIATSEAQGNSAGDLMDQRDSLLSSLSEKVGFTLAANGDVSVGGQLLVSGDGTIRHDLTLLDAGGQPIQVRLNGRAVAASGGSLGGWIAAAGRADDLQARLDKLAGTLVAEVNASHASGYDLDGNAGTAFFTGTGAANIAVAISDPRLVAAANTVQDPGPPPAPNTGDGANALELAQLFGQALAGLDGQTFSEYHAQTLSGLGASVQTAQGLADDGLAVVNVLKDSIQSESGVSLDEEMVDMLASQRAYQAASRLITTIDGMLDTVINKMA